MNVLMINGSPHGKGNTAIALREMEQIFEEQGIETEIVHVGNQDIRGMHRLSILQEKRSLCVS